MCIQYLQVRKFVQCLCIIYCQQYRKVKDIFTIYNHLFNVFVVVFFLVSDAKKVQAWGRGLQPTGVRVRDVADFRILTENAGEGTPEVVVIGPGMFSLTNVFERKYIYNSDNVYINSMVYI